MTRQLAHPGPITAAGPDPARLAELAEVDRHAAALVPRLVDLAQRGLASALVPGVSGGFAATVRAVSGDRAVALRREGASLRYAAIASLGLAGLPVGSQRTVLSGRTAEELADDVALRARTAADPGAVALAAWAQAEVGGRFPASLLDRLSTALAAHPAMPTVDVAWTVTAAVAAARMGDTTDLVRRGSGLLLRGQGTGGLYPHLLPRTAGPRWRRHVGSFADQIYPVQALARAASLTGDAALLTAAGRTAERLCRLQGPAGQWWWHYDSRHGTVVERYPVYSVHQHAMAPMALLDLRRAGGADHRRAIATGLSWLEWHPEVVEELVSERFGVVWRKVGRREPRKAARGLGALTTAAKPGLRLAPVERLLPPTVVDHECRPYELGWLLYAWAAAPGGTHHD